MFNIVDIHSRFLHVRTVALLPQVEIQILVPLQPIVCDILHKFPDAFVFNRTFVVRGFTHTIETSNMQMPFGADEAHVAVNAGIIVDMAQMLTCARAYFFQKRTGFPEDEYNIQKEKNGKEGRKSEGKKLRTKVCWVCEKSSKTKVGSQKEQKNHG